LRRRLDVELVRRGLAPSRTRAADAIAAGRVTVSGLPATTPARQVDGAEPIVLRDVSDGGAFVSRGGTKLAGALDAFAIDVAGERAVDVGASTGGFTDCLLQRGADHVVAIDVGRGQLAWALRNDPRVTLLERTNVRELAVGAVDPPADLCVADLSFISLRTVAPNLVALTMPSAEFVLLVKPQFEAGRARLGKGGIVRDPAVHEAVLREVVAGLDGQGLGVTELVASSLRGAEGNLEFFVRARRGPVTVPADEIARVVAEVHGIQAEIRRSG
jgi:23S rRNA (cytidine1920-2'-O)/16S rRNA (cytidine1409-2'-O)-methyltransferase